MLGTQGAGGIAPAHRGVALLPGRDTFDETPGPWRRPGAAPDAPLAEAVDLPFDARRVRRLLRAPGRARLRMGELVGPVTKPQRVSGARATGERERRSAAKSNPAPRTATPTELVISLQRTVGNRAAAQQLAP